MEAFVHNIEQLAVTLTLAFLTLSGLARVIRDEVRQWRNPKK
jgi:hypothetical protein